MDGESGELTRVRRSGWVWCKIFGLVGFQEVSHEYTLRSETVL